MRKWCVIAAIIIVRLLMLVGVLLQAVIESLLKHGRVPVRVTGPMGHPTRLPYHYDHLLLIAGGVAVSLRNLKAYTYDQPPPWPSADLG